MATFQILQDSEKENTQMPLSLKEKAVSAMLAATAVTGIEGKSSRTAAAGSKLAFREVGNLQTAADDKNTAIALTKKSTVVPVLEQFKSFSVYEDRKAWPKKDLLTETTISKVEQQVELDKENVYQRVDLSSAVDFVCGSGVVHGDPHDYLQNDTAMSVADVLSPMSVDRSLITTASGEVVHESYLDDDDVEPEQRIVPVPRNDRERFFEVVEYQQDILEYFREAEQKHRPKPNYMRRQTDINYSMRAILVDWLVEVSDEYNLDTETLYLSISYIDRFLSHMSVVRNKLQLVGTAAMYIASKYEEIYPPDVAEFAFITDDTYNKAQVLRMEQIILKILAFYLCTPTSYVFISTYAVLSDMTEKLRFLTEYICELSLLEADPYLRFLPSVVSAASLALARYTIGMPIWTAELEKLTTYSLHDLREVVLSLCKTHMAASTLAQQAIQDKYKAEKYKKVSTIAPLELSEDIFDEVARKYAISHYNDDNDGIVTKTATSNNEHVRRMISQMFN